MEARDDVYAVDTVTQIETNLDDLSPRSPRP